MFAMLEVLLFRRGCDNTLSITERWLRVRGHDVAHVVRWLNEQGGYCDFEVVSDVVPNTGLQPV